MILRHFRNIASYFTLNKSPSSTTAWIVFIISISITFALSANTQKNIFKNSQLVFETSIDNLVEDLNARMIAYENTLQNSSAMLHVSQNINKEKWHIYTKSLNIDKYYPGFQGIGYSKVISEKELDFFITKMKADGFPDYKIKPNGKREQYHAIMYLEPLNSRNMKAIGYDMYSNPTRQEAMASARDSGHAALSGKVTLVQEITPDVQAGFLMYVPHYVSSNTPQTVEQKREMLDGFVYAPFRAGDLMNEILQKKYAALSIKLYDGTKLTDDSLLFSNAHMAPPQAKPFFHDIKHINLYGHSWTAVIESTSKYDNSIDFYESRLIVFTGVPISILLFITIMSFASTAEHAKLLAREMTLEINALNDELENIFNIAPNPIILHTQDGVIVKINHAWSEISGYSLNDTPTVNDWIDKTFKENKEDVKNHVKSLFYITDIVDEGEFAFFNKTGEKRIWQFSSAPFGFINGKQAVISSAMDITALKNKDELMIMQSRHAAMGEMISMIAHQWRQPLAAISTTSGTLSMDVMMDNYNPVFFTERLDAISDYAVELSSTINDFRNFFKEDKSLELTSWDEIIAGSLLIIKPALLSRNITLSVNILDTKSFSTFKREIKQVVLNILKNAEDALSINSIPDPQIWIRSFISDSQHCLEIEDNAGGIPRDIVDKIFDPYFTTKINADGTGIGLYMSKTIVEQHCGGSINIKNTSNGACFKISLP